MTLLTVSALFAAAASCAYLGGPHTARDAAKCLLSALAVFAVTLAALAAVTGGL